MEKRNEYTVEFDIDVISKRSLISRKSGEIYINSHLSLTDLKKEENAIKALIYQDVQPKVKQQIFNIEICKVKIAELKTKKVKSNGSKT